MSKKNYLLSLLTTMMVAMLSLGFTSCGSDDDDDDNATGVAGIETLYGTWQQTHGVAFENGAFHHDKDVSADEAEYLGFDRTGTCYVIGGDRGIFFDNGTFSFIFDQEKETLRVGSYSLEVDVLSSRTLKLKYYYQSDEYILATYKKVSDSVGDNLK